MKINYKDYIRCIRECGVAKAMFGSAAVYLCSSHWFESVKLSGSKAPLNVLFSSDLIIERSFNDVPEAYFQLLETSDKLVDVILSDPTFVSADQRFLCQLPNSPALRRFLQQYKAPLFYFPIDNAPEKIRQIEIPLQLEKEPLIFEEIGDQKRALIEFKRDGSFQLWKK